MKIILVEDDKTISSGLKYYLEKEGYETTVSESIANALDLIGHEKYDLALLDVTLKDGTGFDLFAPIKEKMNIPVIFLTALDDELNVIKGFELGADDYITKPFRASELLLRIKAVLRRYSSFNEEVIYKDIRVDLGAAKVYKNGLLVELTVLEYKLLLKLLQNKDKILGRELLLSNIWDVSEEYVNDNTLTVYIKRLREKIETDPNKPEIIKTVRGLGYKVGE